MILWKKVTRTFLSAYIPLCKINNKHIETVFHDIVHSLPFETSCRKTVLQFSAHELERIGNAAIEKQIFLVVVESTLSGIQYLILVGSLETFHVSYFVQLSDFTMCTK